jgi:hypothetical protein
LPRTNGAAVLVAAAEGPAMGVGRVIGEALRKRSVGTALTSEILHRTAWPVLNECDARRQLPLGGWGINEPDEMSLDR